MRKCCPGSHVSHPGHRIAYWQPDHTPHPQTGETIQWGEQTAWECDLNPIRTYLGVSYVEVPTAWDVKIGDKVVCLLSDAAAAVEVTSITYRDLDLTAHGLGHEVHVVFGYTNAPWWVDQQQMTAAVAGNDLLVVLGQEVTTRTGHWVALGLAPEQEVEWRYGVRDDVLDRYLAPVREVGGLCVAAHPHAPYPGGVLMYPFDAFDLVEVWNGLWRSDRPWNADNEAALAEWGRGLAAGVHRGRWQPAIGNSDAHLAGQPSSFRSRSWPSATACKPAASRSWHGSRSTAYRPAR